MSIYKVMVLEQLAKPQAGGYQIVLKKVLFSHSLEKAIAFSKTISPEEASPTPWGTYKTASPWRLSEGETHLSCQWARTIVFISPVETLKEE